MTSARPAPAVGTQRLRRTSRIALAAAVVVPLLSGCGAGRSAQTNQPYAPADGTQASQGDIRVLNAVVVSQGEGTPAVLSTSIANNASQADEVTAVTVGGTAATIGGRASVPAKGILRFGGGYGSPPSGSVAAAQATVEGLTAKPGDITSLTVTLARGGSITFAVPVVPASGFWSSAIPSASASGDQAL